MKPTYVLVTPAKNEGAFLQATIRSVLNQTHKPLRWVIVNDASDDDTEEVVRNSIQGHSFIQYVALLQHKTRSFAGKVNAFNVGYLACAGLTYSFIGNLDADIELPPDYYERVLDAFEAIPTLGIAGGAVYTRHGNHFATGDTANDSVAGAIQLFRRECFEDIGGYKPLFGGGIDAAAEITARMKGWQVRKCQSLSVREHRRTGSAQHGTLPAAAHLGKRFHSLGYSTLFFLLRCLYRASEPPLVLGSLACLLGFFWAKMQHQPICLPPETVTFLRAEQRLKLRMLFFRWKLL